MITTHSRATKKGWNETIVDGWNDLRSSPMLYRHRGCLKIHVSHELYETGKYIGDSWWLATSVGSIGIGWNCNDAMCMILER